jgi:parallel beta-helix repeat protein
MALWLVALSACGSPGALSVPLQPGGESQSPPSEAPQASQAGPPALATAAARPDVCMTPAATTSSSKNQAALGVSYDQENHTIILSAAGPATLAGVGLALGRPELLEELRPGEWLLSANIEIRKGASLTIAGPEARWLKLRSDSERFVSIKALGGRLVIADTCISSWDTEREQVDEHVEDGRSFLLARDGAWMSVHRSHLHHLGYDANESYGLAWRLKGTGGEIVDSEVGYNYYGLYTNNVQGLIIRGNEVHHSTLYGIDPHTSSNGLLIEGNISHHNGKHGIILAEGCSDSVIRNNIVYSNTLHGIVLYNGSNDNRVEGNTSYDNGEQGINLNDVSGNQIRNNIIYGNTKDGIGVGQDAKKNDVVGNTVRDNLEHGIYIYSDAAGTIVEGNQITGNRRYGLYIKSDGNQITTGNRISENQIGVYAQADDVTQSTREENEIRNNREADVRATD